MSITIAAAVAPVKLIAPVGAIAGFDRWAAARMAAPAPCPVPTVAEDALADRLAFEADGGDPDLYEAGWREDAAAYVPTPQEEAEERGYRVGLVDGTLTTAAAFPGEEERAIADGRLLAFSRGRLEGRREHQRLRGEEDALAGLAAAPGRSLAPDYLLGYTAGRRIYLARQQAMADHFARLSWEAEYEAEMREVERHNREAGSWPVCYA